MRAFHINHEGIPGECSAKVKCPFGDETEHYTSLEAARAKVDEHFSKGLSFAPTVKISSNVSNLETGDSIDLSPLHAFTSSESNNWTHTKDWEMPVRVIAVDERIKDIDLTIRLQTGAISKVLLRGDNSVLVYREKGRNYKALVETIKKSKAFTTKPDYVKGETAYSTEAISLDRNQFGRRTLVTFELTPNRSGDAILSVKISTIEKGERTPKAGTHHALDPNSYDFSKSPFDKDLLKDIHALSTSSFTKDSLSFEERSKRNLAIIKAIDSLKK